jgi:hypothetical protein
MRRNTSKTATWRHAGEARLCDMDQRRIIGPPLNELPALAAKLAAEADELLSSPRWRLLVVSSKVAHHLHAAAALRHVVALLEDVVTAVQGRREAALRVLGRAHIEACLVGLYVTAFGDDALADISAGYSKAISSQQTRLAEYNQGIQQEVAKTKAKNNGIRARNRNLRRWNAAHPEEPPKLLTDELPLPQRTAICADLLTALSDGAGDSDGVPPLALSGIVARLNEYGRAQEGPDAVFDMVYDLGYRGLSTFGAHPTLWVLNAYVDSTPRSRMVSTVPEMGAESMGATVLSAAVMLTATLIQKVIGLKGDDAPSAASVSALFEPVVE